jgi:phosphoenolpyruvate---glycerone phosphotransferase subunit DhaK
MMTADEITAKIANEIVADLPFQAGDEVAVLVNGLGATPALELYICYRNVQRILAATGIRVERPYVGQFFTALEMAGFSVTLMKLDPELKTLLDAPADTPDYKL